MSAVKSKKVSTVSTVSKTKKALNLSINPSIDRINLFYEYLYSNMQEYDEANTDYKITDEMLHYYITLNKLKQPWITILKQNRHLLYLDQYINFYNTYYQPLITNKAANAPKLEKQKSFLDFFKKDKPINYKLYILQETIQALSVKSKNNTKKSTDEIIKIYKDNLLNALETLLKKMDTLYTCNINTDGNCIGLITSHGSMDEKINMLVVPADVIIAFVTPLNKYSYQEPDIPKNFFTTLNKYRNNNNFLKNPACYLRQNNCLKHTVYFYPGQLIQNYIFSIDPEKDPKNDGFYTDNSDINQRDEIFNLDKTEYKTTLDFLFNDKYDKIKGKIIYIKCCRKCDLDVNSLSVELLYRYEHITTYINMSKCLAFEIENQNDISCMFDKGNMFNMPFYNNTKNNLPKNLNLFYDGALSYDFKNKNAKPPKYKYMLSTYNDIPKFNKKDIKLQLYELLRNILHQYKIKSIKEQKQIIKYLERILNENIDLLGYPSTDIYNELKKHIDMIQMIKFVSILHTDKNDLQATYEKDLQAAIRNKNMHESINSEFINDANLIDIYYACRLLYKINIPIAKIYEIYKNYYTQVLSKYFNKYLNKDKKEDTDALQVTLYETLTEFFTGKKLNFNSFAKFKILLAYITDFIKYKNNKLNNNLGPNCQQYYETPEYINNYFNEICGTTGLLDSNPSKIYLKDFYKKIKCMPLITIKIITLLKTDIEPKFTDDFFKILLDEKNNIPIKSPEYIEELKKLNASKPKLFDKHLDRQQLIA